MEPLVTVLISSYNHAKYIAAGLESVLNQSYKNLQIIVVDDGSQDDTLDLLQSYEDERLTVLTAERNTAFRLYDTAKSKIQGKYVAELASDDRWTLDKIQKQVDFLENHGEIGLVFSWCEVLTPDLKEKERLESVFNVQNKEMHEWFWELIVEGNKFNNPSVMFRTEVFQKYDGYRFQYRQLQDLELWLRMLPNENVYIMPEKLTYYTWHPKDNVGNMSADTMENMVRLDMEMSYILFDVFRNIDGAFFNRAFARELEGDMSLEKADIICKKFLILACFNSSVFQDAAILFYHECIREDGVLDTLEHKYGFSRADFWKYEGEKGSVHDMRAYRDLAVKWRESYYNCQR